MQRLRGVESLFLSIESRTNLFHVGAVALLDPSTAPPGTPPPAEALRQVVAQRLHLIPPFRRRPIPSPLGLDHGWWEELDTVDLEHHVRRGALPSPGGPAELAEYAADLLSRPMSRDRPLWEIHVVEGLEGDLVAGVVKIHHSVIDGVSGAEVTGRLMDLSPEVAPVADVRPLPPARPSLLGATAAGAARAAGRVPAVAGTAARAAGAARRLWERRRQRELHTPPALLSAPCTVLSAKVGTRRAVAFARVELGEVEEVRAATGVTINDVVLALCGAALRSYLQDHGGVPDRPLVAMVPVSTRQAHHGLADGVNRLSAMLVSLATTVEDPVVRLLAVSASAEAAKAQHQVIGPELFEAVLDALPPSVTGALWRAITASSLVTVRPPFSCVVSNFPGPPMQLYCAGAALRAYHPFGPVVDGAALNVTVASYRDQLGFGLLACRDAVPDLAALAARIPEALHQLGKALVR